MYNDFDVAYENFVSGEVAMIPNGYWMIDQIPESMESSVRFSPFPEINLSLLRKHSAGESCQAIARK